MSQWTHVVGVLYVETYTERKDIKEYVEQLLKNAPKITGSEKDCDIFVNPLSGYNTFISADCEHCQYSNSKEYNEDGWFTCDADNDFECPEGKYQTGVAITIVGDLRDKDGGQTSREVNQFIRYIQHLGNGFDIEYYSVIFEDEWNGKYMLCIEYDENDYNDKGELIWRRFKKKKKGKEKKCLV